MIHMIQALPPPLLHAVTSSQGGHRGLKKHDGLFRRGHYLRNKVTGRHHFLSHTEKYRESCVELIYIYNLKIGITILILFLFIFIFLLVSYNVKHL